MLETKPYIVGQICARGGSKGVKRKNIRLLGDKPLIAWSIQTALQCPSLDRVVISTEDPEIAAVGKEYGAEVPFVRPTDLAQDNSKEWQVWQHTLRTLQEIDGRCPDILVNIPATSPFRTVADVEACVSKLLETGADICITVSPARRNPYFNMVTIKEERAQLVMQSAEVSRRQDAPEVFDITTVAYAARTAFVLRANHLFEGQVCAVVVPEERALDIDTELDMEFAQFLSKKRKT